jgi:hypothetical protein
MVEGTGSLLLRLVDETCYSIVFKGMPSAVPYSRSGLFTGGRGGNLLSGPLNLVNAVSFLHKKKHLPCRNYLRHELLLLMQIHDSSDKYAF